MNSVKERLSLYNQLSQVKDETELLAFEKNLEDRFGPLPEPAIELMASVKIKWAAAQLGLERLVIKNGKCVGYFMAQENHPFYESLRFQNILTRIQEMPERLQIKQKQTRQGMRLLLVVEAVTQTETVLTLMEKLLLTKGASSS